MAAEKTSEILVSTVDISIKPKRIFYLVAKESLEKIILLMSYRKVKKKKLGKYRFGPQKSTIIRLSGPIKTHWAKSLNLDLNQLLGDGKYKEEYRFKMCEWGEEIRAKDSGYFCRAAIDMYNARDTPVWIVSDIRRKSDIQWFTENYGHICKTIRIVCSEKVRQKRGWIYTSGVDDAETECDLDDVSTWDVMVENNNNDIETILQKLLVLAD